MENTPENTNVKPLPLMLNSDTKPIERKLHSIKTRVDFIKMVHI